MDSIIQIITERCTEQVKKADELLKTLENFGWKDTRPQRTEAVKEERPFFTDINEVLDGNVTVEIPASTRIPSNFIRDYYEWYSGVLALIEGNMPSRLDELITLHQGSKGAKDTSNSMIQLLQLEKMTFGIQIQLMSSISHMQSIVASIPAYMEARLYDVELAVAQAYVRDELSKAEVLLKSRHVRAAGAIAGVLLERHLKLLCDRHHPPIRYTKSASIAKLNDLLKNNSVYDVVQWRKVQWMGDIRNSCDHARTSEPRSEDVRDLIIEAGKFVALFVI